MYHLVKNTLRHRQTDGQVGIEESITPTANHTASSANKTHSYLRQGGYISLTQFGLSAHALPSLLFQKL